ncbi:hypothetical protein DZA65_01462 [Dickeya dianthicola]|uniref:Chromosome partition protein Smc n=1 Tax=Dickeya dianthicola TaxID=204039 RepID=A0ABX9NRD1_9GAMM|nr:hypothetical protein [Dickeya dianthicola]AYC18356.1 hypothetical protein DZA65_01462 [Dickeya dianthicola]MBI0440027.1 hypothetical protein [Dickeya dianthicola]MBI0450926.1 hypothetical protein [Dickeya dianthicola]MBI0455373.1 hypothetical protein [Dickeya dianthicola]MBI0459654.1 hypothetical protein [Dickeya dianthicola]
MKDIPWYIGRYDRRNDRFSYFKVVAQQTENGWSAIDTPKKMFPRTGEVELTGFDASQLRPNDWIIFQIDSSSRSKLARAKHPRRIYPYYDLSSAQSLLESRHRLSLEGIEAHSEPGQWAIRFQIGGVILANLTELKPGHLILSRNQNVPEYTFNDSGIITVSGLSENSKTFYMLSVDDSPSQIHDWTPDKHYIENVVQLIAGTDSSTMLTSWLRVHTDEQNGKLKSGVDDLLAATQALRSGELAKKLEEENSLTRGLAEAILRDDHITDLLEHQIQNIAEEERNRLRSEQLKALEEEFSIERLRRRKDIEAEVAAFQTKKKNEIEHQIAQLYLDERERLHAEFEEKRISIEKTLKREKDDLEREIYRLKNAAADLSVQNESLRRTLTSLEAEREASLNVLRDSEEHATLAQLELEKINASIIEKSRQMAYSAIPAIRLPAEAKTVSRIEFNRIVSENKLLTPDGKSLMEQFLALMLAGECPLLYGSETQDFLVIAESLISSGRSIRQIADPTTITYEDLWVRAGNHLATPLYQGLLLSDASSPRTVFTVIERVECSAARFWLPALKDRLRRGDLPRRFLICGTIENDDCEEAEKMKEEHLRLRVEGVIVRTTITRTPLYLSAEHHRELDPGTAPLGSLSEKLVITDEMSGDRLNVINTLRAAKAALEIMSDDENKTIHQKRLVDLFADLQKSELCAQ